MRVVPAAVRMGAAMLAAMLAAGLACGAAERPPAGQGTDVPGVVELVAVGPGARGMNRNCSATGFLINAQGYLLTAAHAVEEARQCLAGSPEARILARPSTPNPRLAQAVSCDVIAVDETHDLAVLKTSRPLPAAAETGEPNFLFLSPQPAEAGTPVEVSGHPTFAWQPRTQTGRVVRRERLRLFENNPNPSDALVLDIELHKGNSGSPVVRLSDGAVIGIVERQDALDAGWSVAVSVRYAIELLTHAGIRWSTPPK
jgi:S1-C subfamily serine protease